MTNSSELTTREKNQEETDATPLLEQQEKSHLKKKEKRDRSQETESNPRPSKRQRKPHGKKKPCKKCQKMKAKLTEEKNLMQLKINRMKLQLHTLQAYVKERDFEILKVNEAALIAQQQYAQAVKQLTEIGYPMEQNQSLVDAAIPKKTKPSPPPPPRILKHFRPCFEF